MDRISAANATVDRKFQDGDDSIGRKATSFNAAWANDVQESLVMPIELAGRAPAAGDNAQLFRALIDLVYPVGRIIAMATGVSPATVYTWQTWAEFGPGRVFVSRDAGQVEFDTLGKQVGAKTHALTVPQMPPHRHRLYVWLGNGASDVADSIGGRPSAIAGEVDGEKGFKLDNGVGQPLVEMAGEGQAHNNVQPSIVGVRWVRLA